MKEFEFTLKFALPDDSSDPEAFVEDLYEGGCDDAIVGIGQEGRLALQFNREADNALDAVKSSLNDVLKIVPEAKLIEVGPDLVGLTDIAKLLGCSRQNIRKLMVTNRVSFPQPVHEGSTAIWRLSKVLKWYKANQGKRIEPSLLEIAETSMQFNLVKETAEIDPEFSKKITSMGI